MVLGESSLVSWARKALVLNEGSVSGTQSVQSPSALSALRDPGLDIVGSGPQEPSLWTSLYLQEAAGLLCLLHVLLAVLLQV